MIYLKVSAQCPAHDDRNPSLSISEKDDDLSPSCNGRELPWEERHDS